VEHIKHVIGQFVLNGEANKILPIVRGHINTTYRIIMNDGKQYTLQTINTNVFRKPDLLMDNIVAVTNHIQGKIKENGGDVDRECLSVVLTKTGASLYRDAIGQCWRMYGYIDNVKSYDQIEEPIQMYNAGVGFGRFQKMLAGFPMDSLHETIPNFHNTEMRMKALFLAAEEDAVGRVAEVREELSFFEERKEFATTFVRMIERGALPLRVTHNDTKVNNILIDDVTNDALCVIDLDTVMPGLAAYDFGDAIRYSANTAAEDERDLSKVGLDMELYEQFAHGFLSEVKADLTETETRYLPHGATMMTLENAVRFLTDYLQGDVYFQIHRPKHNLERARCQIALLKSMEQQFDAMCRIVDSYLI